MSSAAAGGRRPLQLGVGVSGGAEVIVHSLRLLLERNPHWACVGNDLLNGFNAISREKAVQAIHDNPLFAPYLPFVQQSYLREAPSLPVASPFRQLASRVQSTPRKESGRVTLSPPPSLP